MFKFNPGRVGKELGKGKFEAVFLYQKNSQDFKWVVKRVLAEGVDELLSKLPEVVLGFACDHPCIVPVRGYFINKVPN